MIAENPAIAIAPARIKLVCPPFPSAEESGDIEHSTHTPVAIKRPLTGTQPINIINTVRMRLVILLPVYIIRMEE